MNTPLVSIILPTYNGGKHIKESIDSVLQQDYINFELLIINDSSTDNTKEIIVLLQNTDHRIKYFENKKNLGLIKTLNTGISLAQGEYIARIDDDDIWCDTSKLSKQINYLEQNFNCGLCGTGVKFINENGTEIHNLLTREHDSLIRKHMSQSNQFVHSSVVIRKSILDKIGYYTDKSYCLYTEDYDLWLRIGLVSSFHNISSYSVKYRIRENSITGTKRLYQNINALRVYHRYKSQYPKKMIGCISHLINIFLPKKIVDLLVSMNRKYF